MTTYTLPLSLTTNLMKIILFTILLSPILALAENAPQGTWKLQANTAAPKWDLGYPVGNGSMGAINLGGYPEENIYINHDTIWSRTPHEALKENSRKKALQNSFDFCMQGEYAAAEKAYTRMKKSGNRVGTYQYLGEVKIKHLNPSSLQTTQRELNLLTGESHTVTSLNDGKITQSIIASYPDQVIVVHLQSTQKSGLHFQLSLNRSADVLNRSAVKDTLLLEGKIGNHGTRFVSHLQVIPSAGGKVTATGDSLTLKGGSAATLIIAMSTDHNRTRPRQPLTTEWKDKALSSLNKASQQSWTQLRKSAATDHQNLMLKSTIDLGTTAPAIADLPIGKRLTLFQSGGADPDLIELFYQMGRHLLIGSSRPGSLPPNLQGLWEGGTRATWNGDFHLNINVQMNMWPANLTGLNECNEPFFQLITWLHQYGQETARSLGCRGYAAGLASDAWGLSDWIGGSLDWDSFILGGHWAQQHIMENYRFSSDEKFLRNYAWPILKDGSSFILDWLRENPNDTKQLIALPGGSPENIFFYKNSQGKQKKSRINAGNTFAHAVAWETFSDTLECARILGIDDPIIQEIKRALPRVPQPQIAKDGRVMEWREEYKEFWPGHRHKSHLYGFHPGRQFNVADNPELTKAAYQSMEARMKRGNSDAAGGGQTGWNLAWSMNIYARLLQGDHALDMLRRQLGTQVTSNLFNHCGRPYQIDGNLGSVAGIAEMLVQSFEETPKRTPMVRLLPALPASWKTGTVHGLRARGGVTVSTTWTPELIEAEMTADRDVTIDVSYGKTTKNLSLKAGTPTKISFKGSGIK